MLQVLKELNKFPKSTWLIHSRAKIKTLTLLSLAFALPTITFSAIPPWNRDTLLKIFLSYFYFLAVLDLGCYVGFS